MRTPIAVIRAVVAALIVAAVLATLVDTVARTGGVNPFNFFGYFTIQSNILLAAVLALDAGGVRTRWLPYARAAATVYIVIVGLVYGTLLAPLAEAGGVPVPWANTVLHVITPIYGALDWLLIADRPPLRWRLLWVLLVYPVVWVGVVLVRGATDGWVPYPFLNPNQGYGVVAVYCVVIFVVALGFGAFVWWASRLRIPLPALSGSRRS